MKTVLNAAIAVFAFCIFASPALAAPTSEWTEKAAEALKQAGDNRPQLEEALAKVPDDQRKGMEFLIANMPDFDLTSLTAQFLLENTHYAYQSWRKSPWHEKVSEDLFLNYILPYANVDERRDNWRKDFVQRFTPMIEGVTEPGKAAEIMNSDMFKQTNVKYSRQRRRANQGPYETLESGIASCTGLSILLIDACRAVGVPARFVGTPMWSDGSGNHSWVEVWDDGWHFVGACEPDKRGLGFAWFKGKAATAKEDSRMNAIYAISFRKTEQDFPAVWSFRGRQISALNVTSAYTKNLKELQPGEGRVSLRVFVNDSSQRVPCDIIITSAESGEMVAEGLSKGETFDFNNHLTVTLPKGKYDIEARYEKNWTTAELQVVEGEEKLVTLRLKLSNDSE